MVQTNFESKKFVVQNRRMEGVIIKRVGVKNVGSIYLDYMKLAISWSPTMHKTLEKVFGGGGWFDTEFSVHLWSEASAYVCLVDIYRNPVSLLKFSYMIDITFLITIHKVKNSTLTPFTFKLSD